MLLIAGRGLRRERRAREAKTKRGLPVREVMTKAVLIVVFVRLPLRD